MRVVLQNSLLPILACVLAGCGTMNAARPLDPGQHMVGVTFGGPFTTSLGPPIPVPNLIVEGRSGLEPIGGKPVDVNYGVNALAAAFGLMGLHGGATVHFLEQDGARPALSVTESVHFYNNWLDNTKPKESRKGWGLNELDVTASWNMGHHLFYLGGSDIIDMADPELLVSPFLGVVLQPEERRFRFQVESRLLGANFSPEVWDLSWLSPGASSVEGEEAPGRGLVAITLTAAWKLGGKNGGDK